MRIALVQVASSADEPVDERRRRVEDLARSADGADLIVLPELWAVGYFDFDAYAAAAERLTGPTVSAMGAVARELSCLVHVGSFVEQLSGHVVRNTAALLDSDGTVPHTYSKVHVFGYQSREAELLEPGAAISASPTPFGRMGSTTCYDLRFPELWRVLVDIGTELVVVPAARLDHWRLFTTARAVEEQVYVIACNAVGDQRGRTLGGHSRVVGPWGDVAVEAGTDEGITWCDIDPRRVAEVRTEFPVLDDRLPSYQHLTPNSTEADRS